jgi:hypothetical protein
LKSVWFEAYREINENETNVLMEQIVCLKNLNQLDLNLKYGGQEFANNSKSIAIHCNQLKRFEIFVYETNLFVDKQIFNCLGFFKNFNYLNLYLDCEDEESN